MPEVPSPVPESQLAPDLGAGVEAANSGTSNAQPPPPEPPTPAPPASTGPPATLAPVNVVSFLSVPPARLSPVDEFSDISRTTSPGRSPGISMATLPSSRSEPVVLRHDDPSGFFEVILGVTILATCRAWITRVFQEAGTLAKRTRIRSRSSLYSTSLYTYDGTESRHPPSILVTDTTDPARCPTPAPIGPIRKAYTDPVIDLPVRSRIRSALLTKALKLFPGPGRKKMEALETPAEAPTKAIELTSTNGQVIHVQTTLVSSSPPATKTLDPASVPQTPQSKQYQPLPSGQSRASTSQLQRRGSVSSQPSPSQRVLNDARDAAPRPNSNTPSGKDTSTSTSLSYVSAPANSRSGAGEANPPEIFSPVPTEVDVGGELIPDLRSSFSAGVSGPTQTQMTLDETSRHLLRDYQAPVSVLASSQAVTAVTYTSDTGTEDNLNAVAHRLRGIPHDPSGSITGLDYTLNAETPSRNASSTYVEDGHDDIPPLTQPTRGRSLRRRAPRGFLGNVLDISSNTTSGDTPQINILGGPFTTSPEQFPSGFPQRLTSSDSFYSTMGAPLGLARHAALPPASATVEPVTPTTRNFSDSSTPTQPRQVFEPPPIESIPSLQLVDTEVSTPTSIRPIRGSTSKSSEDSHTTPPASFSRFQVYDSYYPESPIPRVEKFIFSPTYGFLSYTRLKMEYRAARRMELKKKLKTILTFGLY